MFNRIKHLREELDQYRWHRGWANGYGHYHIFSLDGGKSWHNVEQSDDGKRVITGPADPGLLNMLRALDSITGSSRRSDLGPIDEGVSPLEAIGLTVTVKEEI